MLDQFLGLSVIFVCESRNDSTSERTRVSMASLITGRVGYLYRSYEKVYF